MKYLVWNLNSAYPNVKCERLVSYSLKNSGWKLNVAAVMVSTLWDFPGFEGNVEVLLPV